MIPTSKTIIQWMKMTKIKNCSKIINNTVCPCADKLRKLTLKQNKNAYEEIQTNKQLRVLTEKYEKCKADSNHFDIKDNTIN